MNRIFEQVSSCSGFECAQNLYIALVGRQHNDFRIGKFCPNRDDRIEACRLSSLPARQRRQSKDLRRARPSWTQPSRWTTSQQRALTKYWAVNSP